MPPKFYEAFVHFVFLERILKARRGQMLQHALGKMQHATGRDTWRAALHPQTTTRRRSLARHWAAKAQRRSSGCQSHFFHVRGMLQRRPPTLHREFPRRKRHLSHAMRG